MTQNVACGAWDYVAGYEFSNLPIGATVRLRPAGTGYRPQELVHVTLNGGPPVQFELIPE